MNKIELLIPAGNLDKLKTAVLYGADAIYLGIGSLSLRSRSKNFTLEELKEGIDFAHSKQVKVYLAANIIAHQEDLVEEEIKEYLLNLKEYNIDAIIASDLGLISLINKYLPDIKIHLSTQLSLFNSEAIEFFKNYNVTRVVLGREACLKDIIEMKRKATTQLEVFIHGSMCMALSGKCVISNYLTNRDANRGGCAHSCRWNYDLYSNDEIIANNFTFSSKDLDLSNKIKFLIEENVDSLKVEGRMKSEHYVALVTYTYRKIIDNIYNNKKINQKEIERLLKKIETRETGEGFLFNSKGENLQIFGENKELNNQSYIGKIVDYDKKTKLATMVLKNYFDIKNKVEIIMPRTKIVNLKIKKLINQDNELIKIARHVGDILRFKSNKEIIIGSIVRIK